MLMSRSIALAINLKNSRENYYSGHFFSRFFTNTISFSSTLKDAFLMALEYWAVVYSYLPW